MNLVCALTARDHKGADLGDSSANSKLVVAACLNSGGNSGGFRTEPGEHLVAHTLRAEHDGSEDGTGRGTPLCLTAWDFASKRIHPSDGLAPTMA